MYEELLKALRCCAVNNCSECGYNRRDIPSENYCTDKLIPLAADAIEQLSKPRWIPATERLPDGLALAVNALRGSYGYREYLIGYIGKNEESDSSYSCESEGEILMNVTHWMPLPEPPKEEHI